MAQRLAVLALMLATSATAQNQYQKRHLRRLRQEDAVTWQMNLLDGVQVQQRGDSTMYNDVDCPVTCRAMREQVGGYTGWRWQRASEACLQ